MFVGFVFVGGSSASDMRRVSSARCALASVTAVAGTQARWGQFEKTFEMQTKMNKTYFDTHKGRPWTTKSTADYAMPEDMAITRGLVNKAVRAAPHKGRMTADDKKRQMAQVEAQTDEVRTWVENQQNRIQKFRFDRVARLLLRYSHYGMTFAAVWFALWVAGLATWYYKLATGEFTVEGAFNRVAFISGADDPDRREFFETLEKYEPYTHIVAAFFLNELTDFVRFPMVFALFLAINGGRSRLKDRLGRGQMWTRRAPDGMAEPEGLHQKRVLRQQMEEAARAAAEKPASKP